MIRHLHTLLSVFATFGSSASNVSVTKLGLSIDKPLVIKTLQTRSGGRIYLGEALTRGGSEIRLVVMTS